VSPTNFYHHRKNHSNWHLSSWLLLR